MDELIAKLNGGTGSGRLEALASLWARMGENIPEQDGNVNNHIHTTFSFSPYSPTKAVFLARMAGLSAAGIIDHESVGGVPEFRAAGRILGLPTTAGFELRVDMSGTSLNGRSLNNPDQKSVAYMTIHGLADAHLETAGSFLKPVRAARGERNRRMCERLSEVSGIRLNYDADVLPLSEEAHGGSVTERHILCALSMKLVERYGKGRALVDWLTSYPGIDANAARSLSGAEEDLLLFDLIGVLKAGFVEMFYLPVGPEECPDVRDVIRFAERSDSILAYSYLGNITNSVTGDKKAQAFEDDYLEGLFETINELGIRAVTYMPARNTRAQLERVRDLCERYKMLQISGEDINSPRQPFISEASKDPRFANLRESTWFLIEHERKAGEVGM